MTTGEQIFTLRTQFGLSQKTLGQLVGCSAARVARAETKESPFREILLRFLSEYEPTEECIPLHVNTVGKCRNQLCGIFLVNSAADVPPGWVTAWHIDCDDYCPECALHLGKGDLTKAEQVLREYSVVEVKDERRKRKTSIRFYRAIQEAI